MKENPELNSPRNLRIQLERPGWSWDHRVASFTMTSQPVTQENIVIITKDGTNFSQAEKPLPPTQKQDSLWKCLKSNISGIGSIQIMCGVMVLSLGIILVTAPVSTDFSATFSSLLKSAHPFIGALCFIISGSLSVIAEQKTTKMWVQCSVAANIMSCLSAIVGFILLSTNLAALGPVLSKCLLDYENRPKEPYHYYDREASLCSISNIILSGTLSVMLICTVLEFGLGALMAAVWWKQAQNTFPGSVHFTPKSTKNIFSSKATFESSYEELLT